MKEKDQFKLMFDQLKVEHKGVLLNKVLCSQLMRKAGDKKYIFGSIKSLTRFICRFNVSELYHRPLNTTLVTFGYYPTRKDHRELMENVVDRIGNNCCFIDTSKWRTNKIVFNIKNIIKSLKASIIDMHKVPLNIMDRLQLAALICFYLNTIDALRKVDFSAVKKYLCLANCLDLENLLTQYLHNKGVQTYSLMDGAYYAHKNEVPIMNIPFENLTSDIQLCWGQFSKDEFIRYGYPESRMKIVGYPKIVKEEPMKDNNQFKKCVVLLSQYVFDKQNKDLINILSPFSNQIDFHLKLHPTLNYDEYSQLAIINGFKIIPKEMTINECVENTTFDFAIAINSTTYYEALMRGLPCLRFFDGSYTPLAGYKDEFSDSHSFKEVLNRIKETDVKHYQKGVNDALEYAIGWGIDKYKSIFN